jgi:hypothetical protein
MISAVKTLCPSRPHARATAEAFDIFPPVTKMLRGFLAADDPFSKHPPKILKRAQAKKAMIDKMGAKAQRHSKAITVFPRANHDVLLGLMASHFGKETGTDAFATRFLKPDSSLTSESSEWESSPEAVVSSISSSTAAMVEQVNT